MTPRTTPHTSPPTGPARDRRAEAREPVGGCLWMIDTHSSTILRCRCMDLSPSGMRLRVPGACDLRAGQQYELTSHLPGQSAPPGLGLMLTRRAEVIRTQHVPAEDSYDLDVGVALVPAEAAPSPDGDAVTRTPLA
jgi:hypothetical protein